MNSPELTPESVAFLLEHRGYPGCTMASLTIRERLEVIEAAARATAPVPAEAYDPALAPEGDDPDEPHATHLRLRERYAECPDCIRAAQLPAQEERLDVERLSRAVSLLPSVVFAQAVDGDIKPLIAALARSLAEPERLDAIDRLIEIRNHLNALRSDGPFMDTLTAEGPWWTPPTPELVRLYDAIIATSDFLDARLATLPGDDQ